MDKKGQFLTKTVFLFIILFFYSIIFVFVGFAFGDANSGIESGTGIENKCILGICTNDLGFLGNIIIGFSNVPAWINAIIFTPLIITLGFLFITSLPTMSGGS